MPAPLVLAIALTLAGAYPEVALERVGRLDDPALREVSGIVKSRRHPGVFWVHNDSENPNNVFAVRLDGSLVRSYTLNALNVDWEDIATDDAGHLYVGDIGNNGGRLPLRAVYQFDEPDPFAADPHRRALPVTLRTYYAFPARGRFDAEGLFVRGETAWVVAKTFDGRDAEVFALPLHPPAPLFRPALPKPAATLPGFTEPVTGTDLSADGRRLVVCSPSALGVFERGEGETWKAVALRSFRGQQDVEAVCWDGLDLVLASEGRKVYRVREAVWRAGAGPGSAPKGPRRAAADGR